MLTPQSYWTAMAAYMLAATFAMVLAHRFWFHRMPVMLRRVLTAILAGLLLTPAKVSMDATTLAPALVVAMFNTLFGEGWSSAVPAFAVLTAAVAAAILLAVASVLVFNVKRTDKES